MAPFAEGEVEPIWWHVKDKDELLVAVLAADLERGMGKILRSSVTDKTEPLLMLAKQLQQAIHLVATGHSRVLTPPCVSTWHDRFPPLSEKSSAGMR